MYFYRYAHNLPSKPGYFRCSNYNNLSRFQPVSPQIRLGIPYGGFLRTITIEVLRIKLQAIRSNQIWILLDGNAFCKVSWFVDIVSPEYGCVVCEQL
jgi:hypothetical protein